MDSIRFPFPRLSGIFPFPPRGTFCSPLLRRCAGQVGPPGFMTGPFPNLMPVRVPRGIVSFLDHFESYWRSPSQSRALIQERLSPHEVNPALFFSLFSFPLFLRKTRPPLKLGFLRTHRKLPTFFSFPLSCFPFSPPSVAFSPCAKHLVREVLPQERNQATNIFLFSTIGRFVAFFIPPLPRSCFLFAQGGHITAFFMRDAAVVPIPTSTSGSMRLRFLFLSMSPCWLRLFSFRGTFMLKLTPFVSRGIARSRRSDVFLLGHRHKTGIRRPLALRFLLPVWLVFFFRIDEPGIIRVSPLMAIADRFFLSLSRSANPSPPRWVVFSTLFAFPPPS